MKKEIEVIKKRIEEENRRKGSTEIVVVDKEREKELLSRVSELESVRFTIYRSLKDNKLQRINLVQKLRTSNNINKNLKRKT